MGSIGWLAIADLHAGSDATTLWPAGEDELRRDLERVHRHAGPFDFVLCAGDVAQAGRDDELAIARARLEKLFAHLASLGSRPALFAVPGNHDLQRPDPHAPAVRPFLQWSRDPELRGSLFWHPTDGQAYRDAVSDAFEAHTRFQREWREAHPLPEGFTRHDAGLLPGDFAASVRAGGMSLGIVGLNSAFLQLASTVHRGAMAIHPQQLVALVGDPHEWATAHDACVLVTHHPPDWLTPDALPLYQGAIFRPEWFAAHFCGHVHEPMPAPSQRGGQAHRVFQSPSLLGLETWIDAHGVAIPRAQGYSAVRLDVDAERRVTMRLWPRVVQKGSAGKLRFIPDHVDFDLDDDGAYTVERGGGAVIRTPRSTTTAPTRSTSACGSRRRRRARCGSRRSVPRA